MDKVYENAILFTDGSCFNVRGSKRERYCSGAGVLIFQGREEVQISKNLGDVDNNTAELSAVIIGLSMVRDTDNIFVCTDSAYVVAGARRYKNFFKGTSKDKPKRDIELFRKLSWYCYKYKIKFTKVKAHSKEPFNDVADKLARLGAKNKDNLDIVSRKRV